MHLRTLCAVAAAISASPALAQAIKPEPAVEAFSAEAVGAIETPDLTFTETPEITDTYDKYFYFHRADTSFDQAFADIRECDAYASGFRFHMGNTPVPYPYAGTLGGAIGGAIGNAMADAIFGSAERRKMRRLNLRKCMGFKGYARFGMEKERWQKFNFEEGNGIVEPVKRRQYLLQQAKVASGPRPKGQELQP